MTLTEYAATRQWYPVETLPWEPGIVIDGVEWPRRLPVGIMLQFKGGGIELLGTNLAGDQSAGLTRLEPYWTEYIHLIDAWAWATEYPISE